MNLIHLYRSVKLTALAPVDSLPFYQRDAEVERYVGRGDQTWAKMSLHIAMYQSKEVSRD